MAMMVIYKHGLLYVMIIMGKLFIIIIMMVNRDYSIYLVQ